MTQAEQDKIWDAINRTSIPEEMIVLYMMANATDIMCWNVFRRIQGVYRTYGFTAKDDGSLAGLKTYCDAVRRAAILFQDKVEQKIADSTFKAFGEGKAGVYRYEQFQDDCRELCTLVLRYIDKTAKNRQNALTVRENLKGLPGGGLFSEKDYERYK